MNWLKGTFTVPMSYASRWPASFLLGWLLAIAPCSVNASSETSLSGLPQPQSCHFAGHFTQSKTLVGVEHEFRTEGQFVFDCQSGVIWDTLVPVREAQVYRFSGQHFRVEADGVVEPLDGRYQSYIGELMLSLISGDEDRIGRDFSWQVSGGELQLQPKRRRLKKVISDITVSTSAPTEGEEQVTVRITDRNQQVMTVNSVATVALEEGADGKSLCRDFLRESGGSLCALLNSGADG